MTDQAVVDVITVVLPVILTIIGGGGLYGSTEWNKQKRRASFAYVKIRESAAAFQSIGTTIDSVSTALEDFTKIMEDKEISDEEKKRLTVHYKSILSNTKKTYDDLKTIIDKPLES